MHRLTALAAAGLVLVSLVSASTGTSSAAFTSVSASTGAVTAAVDWTPPTVAFAAVPEHVAGSVVLAVDAADGETGVREVVVEIRRVAAASSWTRVGVRTAAPWTFAWSTAALPDGPYELRARATDGVGQSASTVARTNVLNTVTVALPSPGAFVRGTVPLTAEVTGLGVTGVRFEAAPAGTTLWQALATATTAPYRVDVSTTALRDGRYDLRAVATGRVTQPSTVVRGVVVDNTPPTAALSVPNGAMRGVVEVTSTATDANGVAQVVLQVAPAGTGAFTDVATTTAAAHRFAVDTTVLAHGHHDLRIVVRDHAGNETVSATQTRMVNRNSGTQVVGLQGPAGEDLL